MRCWNCGEEGHVKRDCSNPEKRQERSGGSSREGTNTIEDSGDGCDVLTVSGIEPLGGEWLLDSGASCHVCPDRSSFMSYKEYDGGSVFVGDGYPRNVVGIGSVHIRMFDGVERILESVKHVPEMKRNVISLGALEAKGCRFIGCDQYCKVVKGARVMIKVWRCNNLYKVIGSTIHGGAAGSAAGSTVVQVWQEKKGHMGRATRRVKMQG